MRLIDADALIEIMAAMQGICKTKAELIHNSKIWQQVKDLPTVDAVPVVHGKWLPIIEVNEYGEPYQSGVYCSECGETSIYEPNYCPNCGARMDEE